MQSHIPFIPTYREYPTLFEEKPSAWGNIPTIIKEIISKFDIGTKRAIEFGVEFGYSTSALSNYFEEVTGIDIFTGDIHAGFKGDLYQETTKNLSNFKNINLVKEDYRNYIISDQSYYDLAHVDIVHTYEDTFLCGEWCVQHSDVTLFHDTISFPDVYKACKDLAEKYELDFYNYNESYGLGILVKKK